jgi:hypothetical protein
MIDCGFGGSFGENYPVDILKNIKAVESALHLIYNLQMKYADLKMCHEFYGVSDRASKEAETKAAWKVYKSAKLQLEASLIKFFGKSILE